MKQIKLYIFLVVLIIMVVINLFLSRETARIQSVSKSKPTAITLQDESVPFEQMQQSSSGDIVRPAITIINPRPNENENPAAIPKQKSNKLGFPQASVEPGQSPVSPEDQVQEKSASGITKIGKYPPEQQKQEMQSQGTMMF